MIILYTERIPTLKSNLKITRLPAQTRVSLTQKPDSFTSGLTFKGGGHFLEKLFNVAEKQGTEIIEKAAQKEMPPESLFTGGVYIPAEFKY